MNEYHKNLEPVDLVYTWVNDLFPGYAEIRDKWADLYKIQVKPERERDHLDLLRYSLRSIEKYSRWAIGNIYIVTMRPQIPSWLNLDVKDPKLKIVHHDEIFENSENLPTFNCNAIYFNIHRIKGLSRYFILFDDDYFLGSNVYLSDFITQDGEIKIYFDINCLTPKAEEKDTADSEYLKSLAATNEHLNNCFMKDDKRRFFRHVPLLIRKDLFSSMGNDPIIQNTISNRFRCEKDTVFDHFYNHMILYDRQIKTTIVPLWRLYLHTNFHRLTNNFRMQYLQLKWLKWTRPKFFCLNDDMGTNPNKKVVNLVTNFLNAYYPNKSCFEK